MASDSKNTRPQGLLIETTISEQSDSDRSDFRFHLLGPLFGLFLGAENLAVLASNGFLPSGGHPFPILLVQDWAPRAVQCGHHGQPNPVQDVSNIHTFVSNVPMRGTKTIGSGGQYFGSSNLIIILEWGNHERRAFAPHCLVQVPRRRRTL